jgi:DNA-binding GntR family transcriptional regulator
MSDAKKSRSVKTLSLTSYISKDLENRITSGDPETDDLSLQALAAYYKVSITPLRSAVKELVDKGIIIKLPNRRLQAKPRKSMKTEPRKAIALPPTQRDWNEVLIKEVVHASLIRNPTYLREDMLSKKYGVGRSIIRQVLSHFAGAGLIDHIPRRGWLAHPLGVDDMNAYLTVREVLELKALRLARNRLDVGELQRIRAICTNGAKGYLDNFDNSVHECIINASGNRYIRQFFQQYVARYYSELFFFAAPETSVVEEMSDEHLSLIDALLERRWANAEKILSAHIFGQAVVLMKLLEKEHGKARGKSDHPGKD